MGEALAIGSQGFTNEAQALWYLPLVWSLSLSIVSLFASLLFACFRLQESNLRGWLPTFLLLFLWIPAGFYIALFYGMTLPSDDLASQEHWRWWTWAICGALAVLLSIAAPVFFRSRLGKLFHAGTALGFLLVILVAGWVGTWFVSVTRETTRIPASIPSQLNTKPNLLLLTIDHLRPDHLSCYSSSETPTPNICRIASHGGTLYEGFAHSSQSFPSLVTTLTSRIPPDHLQNAPSVAQVLQSHGYATGAFIANPQLRTHSELSQGFDEYHALAPDLLFRAHASSARSAWYAIMRHYWLRIRGGIYPGDNYQNAQATNARAMEWLERHQQARFFLFLNYADLGSPYFTHPYDGTAIRLHSRKNLSLTEAASLKENYQQELTYVDRHLGKLIHKLQQLDLWEDAMIVLTASHGMELGEHGAFGSGTTLFEEQLTVPLLVKWPQANRLAPSEIRGTPARLLDVAPSLLRRAGVALPRTMQGQDLAEWVLPMEIHDRAVFALLREGAHTLRATRTRRWKWIEASANHPSGAPPEALFDLINDPAESVNLSEQEPGTAAELARRSLARFGPLPHTSSTSQDP